MNEQSQFIGGEGILTTQVGSTWIIEIDPACVGAAAAPVTSEPTSVASLTYAGKHSEGALAGLWRVSDGAGGVHVTIQTGVCYEAEGDRTIYGFVRDLTFNEYGLLVALSAERRIVIDIPEAC